MPFIFSLGQRVEDRLTHYRGKITARTEYLHASNAYLVEAVDTTGRPIEVWVAEDRLEKA